MSHVLRGNHLLVAMKQDVLDEVVIALHRYRKIDVAGTHYSVNNPEPITRAGCESPSCP